VRRTSSSTEKGRGHRAAQVTVVTAVAVALVATAAAATGSRAPAAPAAAAARPIVVDTVTGDAADRPVTVTHPRGGTLTARFAPRTQAQGAAPDVGTALLDDVTGPTGLRAPAPAAAAAAARTGPTFTALGRTGLSVSTAIGGWAPDGSRFAYAQGQNVYTVRADRTSPVLIGTKRQPNAISWSPAGFGIAVSTRIVGATDSARNVRLTSPTSDSSLAMTTLPKEQGTTAVSWLSRSKIVVAYGGSYNTVSRLGTVTRSNGRFSFAKLVPSAPSASAATTSLFDPVVDPTFQRIAYRQRAVDTTAPGGHSDSIWVMKANGRTATRLGGAATLSAPVWSADGSTVHVLESRPGGRALVAYPAAGGAPTTVIADVTARGSLYRRPVPAGPVRTTRASGRDNIATAISGSRYIWEVPAARRSSCDKGGAQAAVLIRSSSFLEAGPANALAIHKCGPLLVTGSSRLDARVAAELRRILPTGRTVHVVGSTAAVSPAVEASLRALRYRTVRYAGADPYATSVVVAQKGWTDRSSAVFASARNHTDGLVASVPGGFFGPVLLTDGPRMPEVVRDHVVKYDVGAWAVGVEAHRAAPWATNLSAPNGSDTSVVVARTFFDAVGLAVLVDSAAWQDGIAAGASAGQFGNPLLVTPPTTVPARLRLLLDQSSGSFQAALVYGRPTVPTAGLLRTVVSLGGGRFPY